MTKEALAGKCVNREMTMQTSGIDNNLFNGSAFISQMVFLSLDNYLQNPGMADAGNG